MNTNTTPSSRRTVLKTLAPAGVLALAGCLDGDGSDGTPTADGPLAAVAVEETELVVDLAAEASVDALTVVDPNGELFAETTVAAGVTTETFPIEMPYVPGEYEIRAVVEDEVTDTETIAIRPDLEIVDLKLGRNHPDEMYEGASELTIASEVIIQIANAGTGPEEIAQLRFKGDVPNPTDSTYEESGIYDTESDLDQAAENVFLPSGIEKQIYSYSLPFSPSGDNVACTPEGNEGIFTVQISSEMTEESIEKEYRVTYSGDDIETCDISIEGVSE
ncbi:hypothetical protein [Haloparvum sedimenti]|uniref:hypothetical protein n=1 Tax=Haloparvum sedimenti TaxID=1678448 RepID=UPI00071E68D4|nr:hypothetical protein [Haloparvum sedimenti]